MTRAINSLSKIDHTAVPITVLIADDDPDDRLLARDAFLECRFPNAISYVEDGEELMDYLNHRGRFAKSSLPGLILLDLNMPRKNGFEALREIKATPELRHIPIIILTTSSEKEDITAAYNAGASSYIEKPVSFEGLVEVMRRIQLYWLEMVAMPSDTAGGAGR